MFPTAWNTAIPLEWAIRLMVAAACGTLIGLEREIKRKPAGLRTNALISMGACVYMLLDEVLIGHYGSTAFDPTRMPGQIAVGMGFIGAGTIMQGRGQVSGLTSAALMWVTASIGVIIGAGHLLFGFFVTAFSLSMIVIIGRLGAFLVGKCNTRVLRVSFRDEPATWDAIREICRDASKDVESFATRHVIVQNTPICFLDIPYCSIHPEHREFIGTLLQIEDVRQVNRK